MAAVFIAQSTLQEWADAGKVRLEDTVLTLVKEQRQANLSPAVRFTEVLGGDTDPHKLLGKVKTKVQLDEIGAEHYMDSVLCGEVAYQVVEGFLGDLTTARPIGQPRAPAPVALGAPSPRAATPAPLPVAATPAPVPPASVPPSTSGPTEPPRTEPPRPALAEGEGEDEAAALSRLFLDTVR